MEESKPVYFAAATRRNIKGKPDYPWLYTYSNGIPVAFHSENAALMAAQIQCSDSAHCLYKPKAVKLDDLNHE